MSAIYTLFVPFLIRARGMSILITLILFKRRISFSSFLFFYFLVFVKCFYLLRSLLYSPHFYFFYPLSLPLLLFPVSSSSRFSFPIGRSYAFSCKEQGGRHRVVQRRQLQTCCCQISQSVITYRYYLTLLINYMT